MMMRRLFPGRFRSAAKPDDTRSDGTPGSSRRPGAKERTVWALLLSTSLFFNLLSWSVPLGADVNENHRYQQILQSVLQYVETMYVDPIDEKTLLLGAIRGVLSATGDPYTRFLDHDQHQEFNSAEEGQKVGIGVEITLRDSQPVIIAPLSGGPAEKAGVLAGDRIVEVDGNKTLDLPFAKLLDLISGEIGSVVELTLARPGLPGTRKVKVVRGLFRLEYVKSEFLEKERVGYVRLTHFFGEDVGSVDRFKEALLEFKRRNAKGVIVDLRNNAGGHLDMAVTLAGYFLKAGEVVVTAKGRNENAHRVFTASGETSLIPGSTRVVVLINRGSASASEVFSGALQDHGRAVLMGEQSFGKASVQQIVRPLPDDTAALITIQRYYTPKNRSIHGKGLKPDIAVEEITPTVDEIYYMKKMEKVQFIEKFHAKHPAYDDSLPALFGREASAKGWDMRDEVIRFLLRQEYSLLRSDLPDMDLDPVFRRAVRELGG